MREFIASLVLLLAGAHFTRAAVHAYHGSNFHEVSDAWIFRGGHEAMFRSRLPSDPPVLKHGTVDGKAFIKLGGVSFRRSEQASKLHGADEGFTGLVEAVVFEKSQENSIGYMTDDGWRYCCSEEWAKRTKCHVNHLFVAPPSNPSPSIAIISPESAEEASPDPNSPGVNSTMPQLDSFPWKFEIDFMNDDTHSSPVQETLTINETGVYIMMFVVCDPALSQVRVHGETVWKNPRGFLPGGQLPLLPFHASVALLYMLVGVTWLFTHLLHRGLILPQQYLITLVVVLGMTEAAMNYADLASLNETGFANYALQGGSIVVAAAYKATVRLTTLLLSRGVGTLRPSGFERGPLLLALAYFVLYMLHEFQKLHDRVHNDSAPGSPLLRGSLAAVEALVAAWTAIALRGTLAHLHSKGAGVRLLIFRIFAAVLAFIGAACIVYISFEAYVHATHPVYDKWQLEWMHSTFWTLAHVVLVAALCMLWAPGELVSCYMGSKDLGAPLPTTPRLDTIPLVSEKSSLGWRRPQDKLGV
eukprot:jgi/Ulvmu1/4238/UM191_0011.1